VKVVFFDSVGVLALWNERDQWHRAANEAFELLLNEDAVYCTTTYVVAECANALARVPARKHLTELVEGMEEAGGLLAPTEDEWQQAWTRYINGHSGSPAWWTTSLFSSCAASV
jgi:predicted nucleic acid-binding protein